MKENFEWRIWDEASHSKNFNILQGYDDLNKILLKEEKFIDIQTY